jgi:hypothetical protein
MTTSVVTAQMTVRLDAACCVARYGNLLLLHTHAGCSTTGKEYAQAIVHWHRSITSTKPT